MRETSKEDEDDGFGVPDAKKKQQKLPKKVTKKVSFFPQPSTFFTQSELVDPDSPQTAQLGIHFFIAFTTST